MAVLLILEEYDDNVIVRKIPRIGREELEPVQRLANVPGHYVSGCQMEMNEEAKMLTIKVMFAPKLIIVAGADGRDN